MQPMSEVVFSTLGNGDCWRLGALNFLEMHVSSAGFSRKRSSRGIEKKRSLLSIMNAVANNLPSVIDGIGMEYLPAGVFRNQRIEVAKKIPIAHPAKARCCRASCP